MTKQHPLSSGLTRGNASDHLCARLFKPSRVKPDGCDNARPAMHAQLASRLDCTQPACIVAMRCVACHSCWSHSIWAVYRQWHARVVRVKSRLAQSEVFPCSSSLLNLKRAHQHGISCGSHACCWCPKVMTRPSHYLSAADLVRYDSPCLRTGIDGISARHDMLRIATRSWSATSPKDASRTCMESTLH
jgi:hypothetical protein